jgi:serine/threonine protein kinase
MLTFEVLRGPMEGRTFELEGPGPFVVGRGRECAVQIAQDRRVSRRHFRIELRPDGLRLLDLGSRNGTYLNLRKVGGGRARSLPATPVSVSGGDRIRLGRTELLVRVNAPSSREGSDGAGAARRPRSPGAYPEIPGYRLVAQIGEGGYGAVYRAVRDVDGATVAVKVLLPRVVPERKARRRFLQEIALMKRLRHENLVTFLDRGETAEEFYVVMEFCAGGSFKSLVPESGRIGVREAVLLVTEALRGLQYAHDQGVVHRDLKPSNVLVQTSGSRRVPKIADLGLAKEFERAGLSDFTRTGAFAGTFEYMPREQLINFRYVRPASDVWSMGATLYKLLTGSGPREFDRSETVIETVLTGDVIPVRKRRPDIDRPLARVIDRALSIDVEERPASADEFRRQLEDAL